MQNVKHYNHSKATELNEDCLKEEEAAMTDVGAPAPFIAIQPFPALLDLPMGSGAVKASCGSRHTAVVTREWTGSGWGSIPYHSLAGGAKKKKTLCFARPSNFIKSLNFITQACLKLLVSGFRVVGTIGTCHCTLCMLGTGSRVSHVPSKHITELCF